jgi:hypothetical protein
MPFSDTFVTRNAVNSTFYVVQQSIYLTRRNPLFCLIKRNAPTNSDGAIRKIWRATSTNQGGAMQLAFF